MSIKMFELNEKIEVRVFRTDAEPNFDRACESAMRQASMRFDVSPEGHFDRVTGSDRSRDCLMIEFKKVQMSAGMSGLCCVYIFDAWVERGDDE